MYNMNRPEPSMKRLKPTRIEQEQKYKPTKTEEPYLPTCYKYLTALRILHDPTLTFFQAFCAHQMPVP